MRLLFLLPLCSLLLPALSSGALVTYFLPHYYGRSDSPFYQGIQNGTIYLEDFEDRLLNTPYVTGYNGGVGLTTTSNAVDEDDGIKDGRTTGAHPWSHSLGGGGGLGDVTNEFHFDFTRDEQGRLPEYAGAVILGFHSSIAVGLTTSVLVYDAEGNELTGEMLIPIPFYPRETPFNSSIGDRFVGFYVPGGISSIWFPRTASLDHLQYGYAIPEPTGNALLLAGLAAGSLTRRRASPRCRLPRPAHRSGDGLFFPDDG